MSKVKKERKSNITQKQSEEIRNPFTNSLLPSATNFLAYFLILLILFICYFFAASILGGTLSLLEKGSILFKEAMHELDIDEEEMPLEKVGDSFSELGEVIDGD